MITFGCDACLLLVRVVGDVRDIENLILGHSKWKDGYPCIGGCGRNMFRMDGLVVTDEKLGRMVGSYILTPQECFSAFCGFGLPDELDVSPEIVDPLLKQCRIIHTELTITPSKRTILNRLDLDNGISLHLTSSVYGAVIFKMTRIKDGKTSNDICLSQKNSENNPILVGDSSGSRIR